MTIPRIGIPLALFVLAPLALGSCSMAPFAGKAWVSGSVSALPNLGFSVAGGQVFAEEEATISSLEVRVTIQPWDDEDVANDGNAKAGTWSQVSIGVHRAAPLDERRHWYVRAGLTLFRAEGEPNIIQDPGDYEAVHVGVGFQTELTKHVSMGPEVSLLVGHQEGGSGVVFVPQFNWGFVWRF